MNDADQIIRDAFEKQNKELRHILHYMIEHNLRQLIDLEKRSFSNNGEVNTKELFYSLHRAHLVFITRLIAASLLYKPSSYHEYHVNELSKLAESLGLKITFQQLLEKEIRMINEHLSSCTSHS